MKEPFKCEEVVNISGGSDNDCVGCGDEQEGKRKKRRKEGRKDGRKEARKDGRKK